MNAGAAAGGGLCFACVTPRNVVWIDNGEKPRAERQDPASSVGTPHRGAGYPTVSSDFDP
jgi:hypothetical protein